MNNDLDRVTKALIYFGVLAVLAVGLFIQGALFADTRAMALFMGILLMVSGLSLFVWKNYLWPSRRGEEVFEDGK